MISAAGSELFKILPLHDSRLYILVSSLLQRSFFEELCVC